MPTSKKRLEQIAKYDRTNTKQYVLKLNKKHDADIIEKLDLVENRQGYIKALIRKDLGE